MSQHDRPQKPSANQREMIKYDDLYSKSQGNLTRQTFQVSGSHGTSLTPPSTKKDQHPITIGEALEATALTAGKKNVDRSDAAAIQAAEVRATGRTNIMPGGLAATAQSAAQINARTTRDEEKTKLVDILMNATTKLPRDRPVTRQDAEGVVGAELRNNPNISTYPGGVAASVVAAARINQSYNDKLGN